MSNSIISTQTQASFIASKNISKQNRPHKALDFGQFHHDDSEHQIAQTIIQELPNGSVTETQLLQRIKAGQRLLLPEGYRYDYGIIRNGKLETSSRELQTLLAPLLRTWKLSVKPTSPQAVVLKVKNPKIAQAFDGFVERILKKDFSHEVKNSETGITTNNVVLTDFLEKLISGNMEQELPKAVVYKINHSLNGETASLSDLKELYHIEAPENPELTKKLNQNLITRQKLIGLELAQKLYAENQEVEWQSIALSLALGIAGEPSINAIFKDGGPIASVARTCLMSGVDIMGNILSVMGVVNENLKARDKRLSVETVFGPKDKRHIFKDLLNPKGEAGPDIKQGVKAGFLGGMIGILFNIPAGTVLSMPNASILSRSMIGGIGAAGSGVAIPPVIKSSKESFIASILALEAQHKIVLPKDPIKKKQAAEKIALKELNARIGMASSIKATHPIPLAGTGGLILASEKFGIPREYVQTAYMALAPVMHNFLRLIYTGVEKYWTIPRRMKKLQQLVQETQDQPFNLVQKEKMDKIFLSKADSLLTQGLSDMAWVFTTGSILLTAEVLYFLQVLQGQKGSRTKTSPLTQPVTFLNQAQIPMWAKTSVMPANSMPQYYTPQAWPSVPLRHRQTILSPVSSYPSTFTPSSLKYPSLSISQTSAFPSVAMSAKVHSNVLYQPGAYQAS